MKLASFLGLALAAFTGPAAIAQVQINEIFASHTGTDDMEFIELKGTPLMKLDGYMVLVVEGDSTNAGILDRAWDLKGQSIPVDGYFVLGDDLVSTVDFKLGASNNIENGTDTFYLVAKANVVKISALLGKQVEDPNNKGKTILATLSTFVDIIAMVDGGITRTDKTFDGAKQIGPDGRFLPAGIYRAADLKWCETGWLDFDDVANKNAPSTAGAKNTVQCGAATIAPKGTSCLTGAGTAGGPVLSATKPAIGKSFDSTVTGAGTSAAGFLYAGMSGGPTPFLGCSIHLNIATLFNLGPFTFTATTGVLKLPLPYNVSLVGLQFATQGAVASGSSLHLTNAMVGTVGF